MLHPGDKVMSAEHAAHIAAGRMKIAAMQNAFRVVRAYLDNAGKLPEDIARLIDEVEEFTEPTGHALFENFRVLCNAAQDPDRVKEIPEIGARIAVLIGTHDGAL